MAMNYPASLAGALIRRLLFVLSALLITSQALAYELLRIEQFSLNPAPAGKTVESGSLLQLELTDGTTLTLQLTSLDWFDDTDFIGFESIEDLEVFSGTIIGQPQSWARITIDGKAISGLIDDGFRRYEVTNIVNGKPLWNSAEYAGKQRTIESYRLGVVNALVSGKAFNRVVPIAIVVDDKFDAQYFGRGLKQAINMINGVDGIFRQELGIAIKLDIAIFAENEAFSRQPGASPAQLTSFSDFRKRVPELQSDVSLVHLFTGSALPTFQGAGVGYAFIGTACSAAGLDVSVSAPYYRGVELAAHEIAHNLGALHDIDTIACKNDNTKLMDTAIDGATALSTCSVDRIEATLQRTSCYLEVHDGAIALKKSGESSVVVSVKSDSAFSTSVFPEIQLTFDAKVVQSPAFCHNSGTNTLICNLPALTSNQNYQFSIDFQPGGQNTVLAEYSDGVSFDTNQTNNTAELSLTGGTVPVRQCVDTDGDGYGWDGVASCRPVLTDNQRPTAPTYTDQRNGQPVYLSRANWNAADLVNRAIECRSYSYDSSVNQYLLNPTTYTRFRHLTGASTDSGSTEVARYVLGSNQTFLATAIRYSNWTIQNGAYNGPAPFSRSEYIQLVSAGTGSGNALRSYSSNISFDQCTSFPEPSAKFGPTGQSTTNTNLCLDTPPLNDGWGWDGQQSCKLPVTNTTAAVASPTLVVNSGSEIVLDGLIGADEWRLATNKSVAGNALSLPVAISGLRSERGFDQWQIMHDRDFLYLAVTIPDSTPIKDSVLAQQDDSLELFIDGGNQAASRYDSDDAHFIFRATGEITGVFIPGAQIAHVRRYDNNRQQYTYEIKISKFSLQLSGAEFGIDLQVNNDQNGGERDAKWGWSGVTGSNTHWYKLTNIGKACLDTSARSARCQSTTTTSTCIDTGVIGDGWGWNGSTSCRISSAECIDTGVIGDGWGWDGLQSCRLTR